MSSSALGRIQLVRVPGPTPFEVGEGQEREEEDDEDVVTQIDPFAAYRFAANAVDPAGELGGGWPDDMDDEGTFVGAAAAAPDPDRSRRPRCEVLIAHPHPLFVEGDARPCTNAPARGRHAARPNGWLSRLLTARG